MYPGNVADAEEFSVALARIVRLLDQNQMARDTVTLVFDKGTAALDNTVQLEEAGVEWISALPWNQAPQELRERATEELPPCSAEQRGCGPWPRSSWCTPGISRGGEIFGAFCGRAAAQPDPPASVARCSPCDASRRN